VFLDEAKQGGGPLIDIGTHALDLTLWMMDNYKPKSVTGSVYKKLNGNGDCGNSFGVWDPKEYTVEDSAFGFVTMENGATVSVESSWAINMLETREAQTILCGTKAGADMKDGLRINGDDLGRLYIKKPNLGAGGVAFFDGASGGSSSDIEALQWINAIRKGTYPTVLPEQAIVVTQILEGIYQSTKTGSAVVF
jgi:predicted dehydrogenase